MTAKSALPISFTCLTLITVCLAICAKNQALADERANNNVNTIKASTPQQSVVPDFAKIQNVVQKKQQFFAFIRDSILKQNAVITKQRAQLASIRDAYTAEQVLTKTQLNGLNKLARRYHIDEQLPTEQVLDKLWRRVDIIPPRLVMVQAANESGWGTSRFAREGLNFFGHWCYVKGCGLVPKNRQRGNVHEVRKYQTLDAAVERYFYNLNTHHLYKEFRDTRYHLRQQNQPLTAVKLAQGLTNYSIKRQAYVDELISMINHNWRYFGLPEHNAAP
jgi:Bax protein